MEEAGKFEAYFNVDEPLSRCSSHRYLAMRRGEAEGFLKIGITVDNEEELIESLCKNFARQGGEPEADRIVTEAVTDSYRRLIRPSIITEIEAEAKEKADTGAIGTFAANLHQLLLSAPLGAKPTMGIDPGFRTGCKLVCLDANGNLLYHDVIYPTPPRNYVIDAQKRVLMHSRRQRYSQPRDRSFPALRPLSAQSRNLRCQRGRRIRIFGIENRTRGIPEP